MRTAGGKGRSWPPLVATLRPRAGERRGGLVVAEPVVGFPAGPDQQALNAAEEAPQTGTHQVAQPAREGAEQVTQLVAEPAQDVWDQLLLSDDEGEGVEHHDQCDEVSEIDLEHGAPHLLLLTFNYSI